MLEKNNTIEIDLFQIHYYLKDKSHSMNAVVLNKIEAEFLKISQEISKIYDYQIIVETQATEEGGLRSIYRFITNSDNIRTTLTIGAFVTATIGNILTNVISEKLSEDKEQTELTKQRDQIQIDYLKGQKELTELNTEKTKLEIKNLKQNIYKDSIEIINLLDDNQQKIDVEIDKDVIDEKISRVVDSTKIKTYKSNFYKNLSKDKKVKKVSTVIIDNNRIPISTEKTIERNQFKDFIYKEKPLEPLYYENIELEIIAPVLINNTLTWKGIFREKNISFSVKDKDFINLILNKGLSFSSGTILVCDLEIKMKTDSNGRPKEGTKTIYDVTQIKYSNGDIIDV